MRVEEPEAANLQTSQNGITKAKSVLTANKDERFKFLNALRTRTYARNKIISFPEVSRVLGWYKIRKAERDELLYEMQEEGYLKIVAYHGIILEEGQQ